MSETIRNAPRPESTGSATQILERQACQRAGCVCRSAVRRGHGRTHCPVHHDPSPSLNVQERDGRVLVHCHAGCAQAAVVTALRELGLFAPQPEPHVNGARRTIVATYDYRDEQGALLYQVVRYVPKDFRQRKPDGAGGWGWKLEDTRRVLYRLPELLAADPAEPVYVVEGEKDADRLGALGLVATCNVGGAGKWRPEYAEFLRGRPVVVIGDHDQPGQEHARAVASSLSSVAASVHRLELPDLPEHGDVSVWLDAGHTVDDLRAGAANAQEIAYLPPAFPEPENRGRAVLSALGEVEYVADLVRPGRILVVAATEGSGKSYAIDSELGIRVAIAGGAFAGTWPVVRQGGVLILSEMHPDDDFKRESAVLSALQLERSALDDCYWRQDLSSAAIDKPALDSDEWRAWIVDWCRQRGIILQVFDTATGATVSNPWGQDIHAVYRNLRVMLAAYPALSIVLIVHCKKPSTRGGSRDITDVIGEWGRWCDVVLMLETASPGHVKLTTYKRVREPRRIVAAQRDGLLVEPRDIAAGNAPKVATDRVVRTITEHPGLSVADLARLLEVTKRTAARYADDAVGTGRVRKETTSTRGTMALFPETTETPRHTETQSRDAVAVALVGHDRVTAPPPIYGGVVRDSVRSRHDPDEYYSDWADEEVEQ